GPRRGDTGGAAAFCGVLGGGPPDTKNETPGGGGLTKMTFTTGQVGSGATAPGRRDMTSLFLHNATLIDGTGADPRPGVSVLVEDGRIARLAPASALKSDRDVTVIDATGRFLLPGLTDAHVHFSATGADEVRKAARDQLRRGATQIKVMASGGAASPTDPIDATQFTVEELRAAVDEARVRDTYVLAHAYHSKSIVNCLEAGVRSIEHG